MLVIIIIFAVMLAARGQECGTLTSGYNDYFPWRVGIYQSIKFVGGSKYLHVGTGTLVSNKIVITAANVIGTPDIFTKPIVDTFKVAVVKQLYPQFWDKPLNGSQESKAKEIYVMPRYQSQFRRPEYFHYYVNNIAVIIIAEAFQFNNDVRPACLNFDKDFEKMILQKGAIGNTMDETATIKYLTVVIASDCSDVNVTDVFDFRYRTDKICTYSGENGPVFCHVRGPDRGTGLLFPSVVNGIKRYYLFGVYSYPIYFHKKDDGGCYNGVKQYEFTSVQQHEVFIRRYWNESWWDKKYTSGTGKCMLPPSPDYGSYVTNINRIPNTAGGEGFVHVVLNVTCQPGYSILGSSIINCFNGIWPEKLPTCVRMCLLKPHPSVEYRCLLMGAVVGSRACDGREPPGTLVSPRCREPNYYSASTLPFMRCGNDGNWDYVAKCMPECGTVTPNAQELVYGGQPAKRGELPWHAGIYTVATTPYMQICGGSLISHNVIISAAHCFWTDIEKQLPASQFAVAVGKLYRPWSDPNDDAQKSNVNEIRLPERFQGAGSNFQDDIAMVITVGSFEYKTYVRPVCLSFDYNFDRLQLQTYNSGKVAGWGLTAANGKASPILRVIELPYVEIGTCIANSPPTFLAHITSDKICAGTRESNSALCKGDSGGGLAFPTNDRGIQRYYLRGVVSTAPNNDDACNTATYTSFTHVHQHEEFIKQFLKES